MEECNMLKEIAKKNLNGRVKSSVNMEYNPQWQTGKENRAMS